MAAIYSNGGNRWNILDFNFTKRDALSSVYKISMILDLTRSSSERYNHRPSGNLWQELNRRFRCSADVYINFLRCISEDIIF
jgi:hypothetical protein